MENRRGDRSFVTSIDLKFTSIHCILGQVGFEVFDIVSVGHFTVDSISLPGKPESFIVLGGSVAYVALTAKCFDMSVSVISKVGNDFPDVYFRLLEQEGIDLSGVVKAEDAQTTSFKLLYSDNCSRRELWLKSRAPSIDLGDFPESLEAKIIHIAPVAGEVTCKTAERLRSCAQWLSLDPQGLVRNFGEKGRMTLCPLSDKTILELIDIYKSSADEIKAVTSLPNLDLAVKSIHDYGVKIVIVTFGAEGALLSTEESVRIISAYKAETFVDPTGAGDVFVGGFLAEYIRGRELLWCMCVGSAAASLAVETIGPAPLGDKSEIHRRAQMLYDRETER